MIFLILPKIIYIKVPMEKHKPNIFVLNFFNYPFSEIWNNLLLQKYSFLKNLQKIHKSLAKCKKIFNRKKDGDFIRA